MRKKPWIKWLVIGLVLVAGFFAWQHFSGAKKDGQAAGGHGGPGGGMPAMPVTIAQPVMKDTVEWDEYTGRFEAPNSVEIRARADGYLDSVHFQEGALVKKGDLLFVIDPRPYEASLKEALAAERAAQTLVELSNIQFKRAEQLIKTQTIAQSVYDERRQQQHQAQAARDAAHALSETAKLNLEFTKVRAPVSGRISQKLVTEGNLITGGTANSTLLTTIVSFDPLYFYFDVDEQNFLKYQRLTEDGKRADDREQGGEVKVALMDEKEFGHVGRINFIDNRIDSGTGTIRARAVFDNPEMLIAPGMFGRAKLQGSANYTAVLIRDEAVNTDQARKFVFTVDETGTVSSHDVTLGPISNGLRIIRTGLKGDEWVIIKGLQRAKDGAKVKPEKGSMVEAQAAPAAEGAKPGDAAPAENTDKATEEKK